MGWAYGTYGDRRGATRYWWGEELKGNGLVGKSRRRWAEDKKMDLQEMGWGHGLD